MVRNNSYTNIYRHPEQYLLAAKFGIVVKKILYS